MIDMTRMCKMAQEYEIDLSQEQLEKLDCYAKFLLEYNQKVNLTAITQPEDIEIKHFLDCLLLAKQKEVEKSIADIGSGAGFPGVLLKIYRPESKVCLFEPTGKRADFLKQLAKMLDLDICVENQRAEDAAKKQWRHSFNFVTARAVANLAVLCEYCLPLLKKGGYFIAMKSGEMAEISAAQNAIAELGGKWQENRLYTLPNGAARSLVVIRKIENSKEKYPRNGGAIAKKPL